MALNDRDVDKDAVTRFAENLLKFIGTALLVKPETDSPKDVVASATFTYVDTGEQTLLVTCDHVYSEFERMKEEEPSLELCWAPAPNVRPLGISDIKPFDRNAVVDVCTFTLALEGGLEKVGKRYLRPKTWPPSRVAVGDLVVGIGFPGAHRRPEIRDGKEGLMMVASLVSGRVHSVTDRHFTIADEDSERWSVQLTNRNFTAAWGGMSGGVFVKQINDEEFELAGFMREGGSRIVEDTSGTATESKENDPHELHSTLFASHADLILANGKLDSGLIPF